MQRFHKYIIPENIFLVICLLVGLLLAFVNPPFQGFDEVEHFYRVYAFSDGTLNFKKITSNTDGIFVYQEPQTFTAQIIPVSIVRLAVESKYLNPYVDSEKITREPQKISFSQIKQQAQLALDKNFRTIVVHMIPSYTILSYLPHTIMLLFLKQMNVPPLFMIFMLRLCSLFLYTALMYCAIKIVPIYKYLFLFLSIMPISLYLGSTISSDYLVIGLSFLLLAYTLRLKYDDNNTQISRKELIIFFSIIFLLCVCKFTYIPMIFLFFLLPKEKFSSLKKYFYSFISMITICMLWIVCYFFYNINVFRGTFSYYSTNAIQTLGSIFSNPLNYVLSVVRTTGANFEEYIQRAFCDFGFSDVQINPLVIYCFIFLIVINVLFSRKKDKIFSYKEKMLFVGIILSVFLFIITINYVVFVHTPEGLINGFKGRYLIPLLPLFFMLFDNKELKPLKINMQLITLIYSIFLIFSFIVMLINRYYI